MNSFPQEWTEIKTLASQILHERASDLRPSWLDEAALIGRLP